MIGQIRMRPVSNPDPPQYVYPPHLETPRPCLNRALLDYIVTPLVLCQLWHERLRACERQARMLHLIDEFLWKLLCHTCLRHHLPRPSGIAWSRPSRSTQAMVVLAWASSVVPRLSS